MKVPGREVRKFELTVHLHTMGVWVWVKCDKLYLTQAGLHSDLNVD